MWRKIGLGAAKLLAGIVVAVFVLGVLTRAIVTSSIAGNQAPKKVEPQVREVGNQLMTHYVLPLEAMGLLLTAATIGAVVIAMPEPSRKQGQPKA